jgi:hypothetical protein
VTARSTHLFRGHRPAARVLRDAAISAKSGALRPSLSELSQKFFSPSLLFAFIGGEILCQLILIFPLFAAGRVFVRIAAFVGSLAFLFILQRSGGPRHPSYSLAVVSLLILAVSFLHPDTANAWAGIASVLLHLAVIAPIFWVSRIRLSEKSVWTLFLILWLFHSASAVVGAMQAYFPGRFLPAVSPTIADSPYAAGLEISLADGSRIYRPMGLTDLPGGASMAAVYSVLLGAGFLLDRRTRNWFRVVILGTMALGLVALYLTQVRSLMVMLGASTLAMGVPFYLQRRSRSFLAFFGAFGVIAALGLGAAVSLGGEAVSSRVSTLVDDNPATVYYTNRGIFLEDTLENLIPKYPVGAGLGRWGMVNHYFGDTGVGGPPPLWAEIQWTAWLYDGGVALMIAYPIAVLIALGVCLRIAAREDLAEPEIRKWAAVLFGYGVGALAVSFNSPLFESTSGVDFWILNAAVFAAASQSKILAVAPATAQPAPVR